MEMTGAEILVECLKREGVEIVFGIPGGASLPLFDKLYDSSIRLVLTRHEQGAAHMADGYARSTGKAGVCIATSGPGATNLITGLATAYLDSIPLVAITAQVATHLIGNDAFQEADATGCTRPVTKHNYLVKDVRELAQVVREAFHIAQTGRPGPVHIDVPVDVQKAKTEFVWPKEVNLRSYKPKTEGHPVQIDKAAEMISEGRAAPPLRRGRRDPVGGARSPAQTRRKGGHPGRDHADGQRGHSRRPRTQHRARSACTENIPPTWRCRSATSSFPAGPASTTG